MKCKNGHTYQEMMDLESKRYAKVSHTMVLESCQFSVCPICNEDVLTEDSDWVDTRPDYSDLIKHIEGNKKTDIGMTLAGTTTMEDVPNRYDTGYNQALQDILDYIKGKEL